MITPDQIKAAYAQYFPRSICTVTKAALNGGDLFIKLYLAKDKTEFTNGISHNDPFSFILKISADGTYSEYSTSVTVKAKLAWMAYGSEVLRKKTIKNVTPEKLAARFAQIREFFDTHAANVAGCPFNPLEK